MKGFYMWSEGCPNPLYLEFMSPELPWEKPQVPYWVNGHELPIEPSAVNESTGSAGSPLMATTNNKERVIKNFKFALVEFLKNILNPYWRREEISRKVHKLILKKSTQKVFASLRKSKIPRDQEDIESYLSNSEAKMSKLIKEYVKFYNEKQKIPTI